MSWVGWPNPQNENIKLTGPFLWELSPQVHSKQNKTKGTHWIRSIEGVTEETATAAKWHWRKRKYSLEPKGERAKRNGEKDGKWGIRDICSLCSWCSSIPEGPKDEDMTTICFIYK